MYIVRDGNRVRAICKNMPDVMNDGSVLADGIKITRGITNYAPEMGIKPADHGPLVIKQITQCSAEEKAEAEALSQTPQEMTKRILSPWELRQRFTFRERVAITSSADAGVMVIREDLMTAQECNLDDPSVGMSLDYLISKGLITSARKAEILA